MNLYLQVIVLQVDVNCNNVGRYQILCAFQIKNYVSVDPHVLSSPVIVDLNADRQPEELVLPVTYYFDKEEYR